MLSYLSSPIVSVTVGFLNPKTFHLHQQLLEDHSQYFRAAARVWAPNTTDRIVIDSDIEPADFEVFATFVYNDQNLGRMNVYSLVQAYLLGVKITAPKFKESSAIMIEMKLFGDRTLSVDDVLDLAKMVYANTSRGDALRQVLVDHLKFVRDYANRGTEGIKKSESPVQRPLQSIPPMQRDFFNAPAAREPITDPALLEMMYSRAEFKQGLAPSMPATPYLSHAPLPPASSTAFVPDIPEYTPASPFPAPNYPESLPASPPYSPTSGQLPTLCSTFTPASTRPTGPPPATTGLNLLAEAAALCRPQSGSGYVVPTVPCPNFHTNPDKCGCQFCGSSALRHGWGRGF